MLLLKIDAMQLGGGIDANRFIPCRACSEVETIWNPELPGSSDMLHEGRSSIEDSEDWDQDGEISNSN